MKKLPLSYRISLILLGIMIVTFIVLTIKATSYGSQEKENILPDAQLPWHQSEKDLVETLNQIYSVQGKKTEWALCETTVEGRYQMCIRESKELGPFKFSFSSGKLTGYVAEFPGDRVSQLMYSAELNYPKKSDGHAHGMVLTRSRSFMTYERDIASGHLELYMVFDKVVSKVRIQVRYIAVDQRQVEPSQPKVEEDIWPMDTNTVSDINTSTIGKQS